MSLALNRKMSDNKENALAIACPAWPCNLSIQTRTGELQEPTVPVRKSSLGVSTSFGRKRTNSFIDL